MIIYIVLAIVLGGAIAFLFLRSPANKPPAPTSNLPKPTAPSNAPKANGTTPTPMGLKKKAQMVIEETPTIDPKTGEPVIKILWGSQTGTAESFANALKSEAMNRYGLTCQSIDLERYPPEQLSRERGLLILLLATYGEGEPTDNAKDFHRWLMAAERDTPAGLLAGLRFALFGLGNKTYEHFNHMARVCDKRLQALGAHQLCPRGEGDDDANLEEDFRRWKTGTFWPAIERRFALQPPDPSAIDTPYIPRYTLLRHPPAPLPSSGSLVARFSGPRSAPFELKNPYVARLLVNHELCASTAAQAGRSVRHMELELPAELAGYEPGDHLGVYPRNQPALVDHLLQRLGLSGDEILSCEENGRSALGPASARVLFSEFVDITSVPRHAMLSALVPYCSDPVEKDKLQKMATQEEHYHREVKLASLTLPHLLDELVSLKPSLELLFAVLPRLAPRYYSIASSPLHTPSRVAITVAHTTWVDSGGRTHLGVCSTWLKDLAPEPSLQQVPLFVRRSTFRLPADPRTPIIMIGPGTGVAPFRGFLQHRVLTAASAESTGLVPRAPSPLPADLPADVCAALQRVPAATLPLAVRNILLFGCRRSSEDFLYEAELRKLAAERSDFSLHTAFSRDQTEKVYVQHRIQEEPLRSQIAALLMWHGAHVYVCGDARKMPSDVREALQQSLVQVAGLSPSHADLYLTHLQQAGRYQQDVWF